MPCRSSFCAAAVAQMNYNPRFTDCAVSRDYSASCGSFFTITLFTTYTYIHIIKEFLHRHTHFSSFLSPARSVRIRVHRAYDWELLLPCSSLNEKKIANDVNCKATLLNIFPYDKWENNTQNREGFISMVAQVLFGLLSMFSFFLLATSAMCCYTYY